MVLDLKQNGIQFQLPYNFDTKLIDGFELLGGTADILDCIYLPPFHEDYVPILRTHPNDKTLSFDWLQYVGHIDFLNKHFPNKTELLLQRIDGVLMPPNIIRKYITIGFTKFCVGTIEQAKIIKDIDSNLKIIGSIAMHMTVDELNNNKKKYQNLFDAFVLDFSFNKSISNIKKLPKDFEYIILCNSLCSIYCDGDRHWWTKDIYSMTCPGLYPAIKFENSCLIRPMDLQFFTPYIKIFKLQDRGWDTNTILRDFVLYSSDYKNYPNIEYDEFLYEK